MPWTDLLFENLLDATRVRAVLCCETLMLVMFLACTVVNHVPCVSEEYRHNIRNDTSGETCKYNFEYHQLLILIHYIV